jgi:hypothetical protein
MSFLIYLDQLLRIHMRVALRRAESRMAEQFLNGAQVGAARKEMRGKRMSERVRADAELRATLRDVSSHEPIDAPRR